MKIEKKQLFIEVAFKPGDKVKYGPHDARVEEVVISTNGATYDILWFDSDGNTVSNNVFDWQLELVEAFD